MENLLKNEDGEENIVQFRTGDFEQDIEEQLPAIPICSRQNRAVKRKEKRKKNLLKNKDVRNCQPYLPEEIIFQILTRVPATYLHDKLKYICKDWHRLTSSPEFIAQNTVQNKCDLLISVPGKRQVYKVKMLEMEDKGLDFNLTYAPLHGLREIKSSCNGMILVGHPINSQTLCVMNMLTKSFVTIPQCPSCCPHENCGAALGFDPSAKEYKVVHMYADGFGFEIFTLGCSDNSWKRIPGPFKTSNERPFCIDTFEWTNPVSINGQVFHWYVESNEYIISMDVSDETPRKTYVPEHLRGDEHRYDLLEMGIELALLYTVSSTQIDIWVLEDFHGQNWIKRYSIVAESINYHHILPDFLNFYAVAALRDGKVLMFKHENINYTSAFTYLYDIRERKLKKCQMKLKYGSNFIHHRSSLVQWRNEGEMLAKRLGSLTFS